MKYWLMVRFWSTCKLSPVGTATPVVNNGYSLKTNSFRGGFGKLLMGYKSVFFIKKYSQFDIILGTDLEVYTKESVFTI